MLQLATRTSPRHVLAPATVPHVFLFMVLVVFVFMAMVFVGVLASVFVVLALAFIGVLALAFIGVLVCGGLFAVPCAVSLAAVFVGDMTPSIICGMALACIGVMAKPRPAYAECHLWHVTHAQQIIASPAMGLRPRAQMVAIARSRN